MNFKQYIIQEMSSLEEMPHVRTPDGLFDMEFETKTSEEILIFLKRIFSGESLTDKYGNEIRIDKDERDRLIESLLNDKEFMIMMRHFFPDIDISKLLKDKVLE